MPTILMTMPVQLPVSPIFSSTVFAPTEGSSTLANAALCSVPTSPLDSFHSPSIIVEIDTTKNPGRSSER